MYMLNCVKLLFQSFLSTSFLALVDLCIGWGSVFSAISV